MATRPGRLLRFTRTERAAHWLLALSFLSLTASGFALYWATIARPDAKRWHLWSAIALGIGLALVVALGDRRSLGRTARDLDRFDADDARWLGGGFRRYVRGEPAPPQGRFNAGQKLNAAVTLGLMVVMTVTGLLLWEGERDTRYRFAGTIDVHDWGTWILLVLVFGHIYLAVLNPATRHALRGMTAGDVDREWASRHHAKWVAERDAATRD